MTSKRPSHTPPRPVAAWLVAVNLLMAGATVFVAIQIDEVAAYVPAAPLVLSFLVAAGTYAWLARRRRP